MSFSVKKVSTITLSSPAASVQFLNLPLETNGNVAASNRTGLMMEVEIQAKYAYGDGSSHWNQGDGAIRYRHGNYLGNSWVTNYYSYAWSNGEATGSGNNSITAGATFGFDRAVNKNGGGMAYYVPQNNSGVWGTVPWFTGVLRVGNFRAYGGTYSQPYSMNRQSFSLTGACGQESSSSSSDSNWKCSGYNSGNSATTYDNCDSFAIHADLWTGAATWDTGSKFTLYVYHSNNSQT
tara:strand:- start:305 stop:1012 length:708 start_codon:yes stop_codon:yes gene_type:complete